MNLEKKHTVYREKKISGLQIHFEDIKPLIDKLSPDLFQKTLLGYSERHIPIYSLQIGSGKKRIALWSQMHGDESTATKSMFDIFNYLQAEQEKAAVIKLLKACTFLFIPMLNPDGAARYTRENADKMDLNRDAIHLKTAEGRLLNRVILDFKPYFAFNLHDQSTYYSVAGTHQSTVLAFLAPAADISRKVTPPRAQAMQVIATMFRALQIHLPNQMARYDDSFNENCFGDYFQMRHIPTILIESGYYPGDETREITRTYHFIALLTALEAIATNQLLDSKPYFDIPMNVKNYYDCLLRNVIFNGKRTQIAYRYEYKLQKNGLHRVIDQDSLLFGNQITNQLFHKVIDANGRSFDQFS